MFTLNCRGRMVTMDRPFVMGIINATPDSFYEPSRFGDSGDILSGAAAMIREGVDIIDIGGQSTRPGSEKISEEEELTRVIEPIRIVRESFPGVIISIDTYYASVASAAIEAGAMIVNDISSGNIDVEMIATVARLKVPYVVMHMKGTPQTMQQYTSYDDLLGEVLDFLVRKKAACNSAGIHDVIIDPGFGFSKTIDQNFEILNRLSIFKFADAPLLVGLSRKSTVYKTLGVEASEAMNGTTVLNTIALINGADILRVHDVKQAREAVTLCGRVNQKW